MEIRTLGDFRWYCEQTHTPMSKFIFDTENQEGTGSNVVTRNTYSDMRISLPDRIAFINENGCLCFEGAERIRYVEKDNNLSDLTIICRDFYNENVTHSYKMIIQRNNEKGE